MAVSTTPTLTDVNRHPATSPTAFNIFERSPRHASRVAGKSANIMAWLWLAIMPWPSHAATSFTPADPSQGTPGMSRKKQSGPPRPWGPRS